VLISARDDFLATLDKYTVADAVKSPAKVSPEFKSIPVVHD
jgi:hypothetical protein